MAAAALAVVATINSSFAQGPAKSKSLVKEGAYYEFRGRMSDRDTLANTFTLGWDKGSQVVVVTRETKIFRKGRAARLEDARSGDAAPGFGRINDGKLLAVAVAFGDAGVELPPSIKIPESITLPPPQSTE